MKNKNTSKNDIDRIVDILTNVKDQAGDKKFEEWLTEKDNQLFLDNIRQIWKDAEYSKKIHNIDTDHAWKKTKARLTAEKKVHHLFSSLLKIAATVILLFGLGYFVYQDYKNDYYIRSQTNEIIVPKGAYSRVKLSDGSTIWINSASRFEYPAVFSKQERSVELKGEAYFEVEKDESKPFRVNTPDFQVEVLGTEFSVIAYSENINKETVLLSGKVRLKNFIHEKQKGKEYILSPGQKASLDNNGNVKITSINETDHVVSWINGIFEFKSMPFEELALKLERKFDVTIQLKDENLKDLKFTGRFINDESLEQVLKVIQVTTPIDYKIKNNEVFIYGKKD